MLNTRIRGYEDRNPITVASYILQYYYMVCDFICCMVMIYSSETILFVERVKSESFRFILLEINYDV